MKIILLFSNNKEKCNKFWKYIKNKFIKSGTASVHPIYYLEFFEKPTPYLAFKRVINFIEKNKKKEYIIIDNYLKEWVEHLILYLNIKKTPITHFIVDKNKECFLDYNHLNFNSKSLGYYLNNNNLIIKNKTNHPKFKFIGVLPGSNLYKVVLGYFPKNLLNSTSFFMFCIKRSYYLFNYPDLYIVNVVNQNLKNIINKNILCLEFKEKKNFKIDFKILFLYNFKGEKISIKENIYFENEILRIL
jgi:hypothetical protein